MARYLARGNKFGAAPTILDGVRFASRGEARRYCELKLLEQAGKIQNLSLQPAFNLVVNGTKICRYTADFRYRVRGDTKETIEEFKGFKTREYKRTAKLFQALYPEFIFKETYG